MCSMFNVPGGAAVWWPLEELQASWWCIVGIALSQMFVISYVTFFYSKIIVSKIR